MSFKKEAIGNVEKEIGKLEKCEKDIFIIIYITYVVIDRLIQ